jgi:hypothetical protein
MTTSYLPFMICTFGMIALAAATWCVLPALVLWGLLFG